MCRSSGHRPALSEMWAKEKNGATTMSDSPAYLTGREVEATKVEET